MGGSDAQLASQQAFDTNARLSQQAYGIAIPLAAERAGTIQDALKTGGEPDYVKAAYAGERGAQIDQATLQQKAQMGAADRGSARAVAGGNTSASLNPAAMGSSLAQTLFGSRINEASGKVDQLNKLYGFESGQAQQTGSAAMGAEAQSIGAIGTMRNYNPTYANIMGALNAGGAIYGGFQQAGANQTAAGIAQGNYAANIGAGSWGMS